MIDKIFELRQLLRNRRLSRDELENMRNRKLRALIRHAYEYVPFYRSLFRSVDLSPEDIRTVDDLRHIPVTTKEDLRAAGLGRISKGIRLASCYTKRTSGSMGKPFATCLTRREQWTRRLLGLRRLLDIGFRPQDRVCFIGDPTSLLGLRYRTKCISAILPAEEQIQALQKIKPTLLMTMPSYLRVLLHHIDYRLNDFIRPRALITSGEACSNSLKERIQADTDTEMFNFYAAGESGPIASECIAHEGLHVNADHLILECMKNGKSAEPGEQGVVVFTSLYGYATPYIRYSLGDICALSTRYCSCGSKLLLMEPPIGRPDEVIGLPNGKVLSVSAIVNITLRPFHGIDQFRLIREGPYDFVLKLVFRERPEVGVLSEIRSRMGECLGSPARLDVQIVDFIEEEAGRKYRRFISKIPNTDL